MGSSHAHVISVVETLKLWRNSLNIQAFIVLKIYTQFGTVRCGKCFRSFSTVEVMSKHPCNTKIEGLSPVSSSGSLDSILIHDTYNQKNSHRNF